MKTVYSVKNNKRKIKGRMLKNKPFLTSKVEKFIGAIVQASGIANTAIRNGLEPTGVIKTRHQTGRLRKAAAGNHRYIVRGTKNENTSHQQHAHVRG